MSAPVCNIPLQKQKKERKEKKETKKTRKKNKKILQRDSPQTAPRPPPAPPPPPPRYTRLIKAPFGGDISLCVTEVTVRPPGSLPGLPGTAAHSPASTVRTARKPARRERNRLKCLPLIFETHSLYLSDHLLASAFSLYFQSPLLPPAVPLTHCCGDIVSLN